MLKKGLSVLIIAMFAAPLFADVLLTTSINDVFYRGDSELAGSITQRVNADDFASASTTEPIFIRVTLDHNAALANTLVDLTSTNGAINEEIWLAMTLNTTSSNFVNAADTESVSIVRWVGGENQIWIRVQTSSSEWIGIVGGGNQAPEENMTMAWTFGISARNSHDRQEAIDNDSLKNLPFNTRDSAQPVAGFDTDEATSTLICVDLSGSNLDSVTDSGIESLLTADFIAFDQTAEASEGVYNPGADTGINFSNDRVIARGKLRSCSVAITGKDGYVSKALCVTAAGENDTVAGWVCDTNSLTFVISCEQGGDFLDTDMFAGSYISFNTGSGQHGFRFTTDGSSSEVSATSLWGGFTHGATSTAVYRGMDIVWADATSTAINDFVWTATVKVWRYFSDGATDVDLAWEVVLVNHDGEFDSAPFDGTDQHRRCAPSEFSVGTGTWAWGEFTECTGNDAVLFFPYLPTLQGNEVFWSGLVVVNSGSQDFESLDAIFYHEDGERFDAELPGLDAQNQYTWLLVDDETNGVGLNGVSGSNDGDFIAATPAGTADPESFGETRMSMYIRGSFEAEFSDNVDDGDLDGYLLIGKGGDIDGSYLPRNEEGESSHRFGDLPEFRAKRLQAAAFDINQVRPAKYHFINGRMQ